MNAGPLGDVARIIDKARALHREADELWTRSPIAPLDPVRNLRNELEYRIADLEAIELA